MNSFLSDRFDERYLRMVCDVQSDEYYVNMMRAWYFATALAKQYDAVVPYIENKRLDKWTHNKTIQKAIESYDRPTKQRIKAGIEGLTKKPPEGDIKQMQGYTDGRLRLRIGKYRIVYRYDLDGKIEILFIIDVDSRGDIYKRR